MITFIYPYIAILLGASYNIQVVLEGFGVTNSNFQTTDSNGAFTGSYWSVSESIVVPFSLLLVYSLFLILLLFTAGYTLGRLKGIIWIAFLLVLPGCINLLGYWPQINYQPESFVLGGGGDVGSAKGFFPLIFIGLLTGWSLVVIAYDNLRLTEKFRNFYDHFWYASAILAGTFFIADSGTNADVANLKNENATTKQASAYLLYQVRMLNTYCLSHNSLPSLSCQWANDVQQKLNNYAQYNENIFHLFGPKSTKEMYLFNKNKFGEKEILGIRKELSLYNENLCPITQLKKGIRQLSKSSGVCQTVPASFCRSFPDGPETVVDKYIAVNTVAIASECILPTIVDSRRTQIKLVAKIKQSVHEKYLRWLYFLLFSLIVGGKIANATTKLFSLDTRPVKERMRILNLGITFYKSSAYLSKKIVESFSKVIVARTINWITRILKVSNKKVLKKL
jgi:hypothetical protein